MRSSTRHRHEQILAEACAHQHVSASQLASLLGVSEATVRRDLHALADEGELELVYGGASLPRKSSTSFRAKALRNIEAKRIIGRLAADLVTDGDQIFVDSGTTCFEMAGQLRRKMGVSLIVNSARLALELDRPDLEVIMLGGQYRPATMDTVGPLAMAALEQLRGYAAFIGADGLSMEFGLTASDIESAHLYRLAVRNAERTVLLVDHSKFQAPSLCKIVDFDRVDQVVTDVAPPPPWRAFLDRKNINVIYPSTGAAAGDVSRSSQNPAASGRSLQSAANRPGCETRS